MFVPVNPVEYHGPHLSLHNDAVITRGVARDLHAALGGADRGWPLLMTADLEIGVSPVRGPGTRAASARQVRRRATQVVESLVDLGARRLVLLTFHGDPVHNWALHEAAATGRRRGARAVAPFGEAVRQLIDLRPEAHPEAFEGVDDPVERAQLLETAAVDFHAGYMETSLSLHYGPETVDPAHTALPPCPLPTPNRAVAWLSRAAERVGARALATELRFAAAGLAWFALRPFPGYCSCPHLATADRGAWFAQRAIELLLPVTRGVLLEGREPPAPPMSWLRFIPAPR